MNNKTIIPHLYCLFLLLPVGARSFSATSPVEQGTVNSIETSQAQGQSSNNTSSVYGAAVLLATLEDQAISESSGIVASRHNTDLFWTHNDSRLGPFIYAFDRYGRSAGVWRVTGARARDWEDIAVGPGASEGTSYLYIGDIGDNSRTREEIIVYRVVEPTITSADIGSSRTNPLHTEASEAFHLKYSDGKHNAEALMVHPQTGDIYIVTKTSAAVAKVYKAKAPFDSVTVTSLNFVSEVSVLGKVTGADISPDGLRVVLCDYLRAYEISLPWTSSDFDDIWKQPSIMIPFGTRQQGEAVCYRLDGKAILGTSEKTPTPLIEVLQSE